MKILILRTAANKMNLATYNLQEVGLAKALVRKGHTCDVAYYCGDEADHRQTITFDDEKSIDILWLHGRDFFKEGFFPSLKKYVDDYDVIQVGGYVGLTSCLLSRKFAQKVVNYQGPYFCKDNHGDIKKAAVFDKVLLPLQHKKNMIVGTKSVLATDYMKSKGIEDVTTIGVGLDLDNLVHGAQIESHEFIEELKNADADKLLLYIGVLEERRNIPFLLGVFKKVADRLPDCKLAIIGKGKSEYVSMCMKKIEELGIKDKVIYRESLEQKYMPAVYQQCDAFLLPTRYEIFGMVLLEAMYYGLPVFTTYNGGSSTLMTDENGVVIENLDSQIWCDKIVEVLENEKRCRLIGNAAHKTIEEQYTWDALADKFIMLYEKRLAKGRQA